MTKENVFKHGFGKLTPIIKDAKWRNYPANSIICAPLEVLKICRHRRRTREVLLGMVELGVFKLYEEAKSTLDFYIYGE